MQHSENLGQLATALASAQTEIVAAKFDATNPHFKSKYASLASVMEALKPLSANGIAVIQSANVVRNEDGTTGRTPYVCVHTRLIHSSGEWIGDEIVLAAERDTPQSIGSTITYGRRYLLSALTGCAADADDDGNAGTGDPRGSSKPPAQTGKTPPPQSGKPAGTPPNPPAKPASAPPVPPAGTPPPAKPDEKTPETVEKGLEKDPKTPGNNREPDKNAGETVPPPLTGTPKLPTNPPQISPRVAQIKEIFSLSTKVGDSPDDMKATIKRVIGRSFRDSSEINDDELEKIIIVYREKEEARASEGVAA